jgi:pyruvate formate-lyase activating enzyme-like uncharacterized protein
MLSLLVRAGTHTHTHTHTHTSALIDVRAVVEQDVDECRMAPQACKEKPIVPVTVAHVYAIVRLYSASLCVIRPRESSGAFL